MGDNWGNVCTALLEKVAICNSGGGHIKGRKKKVNQLIPAAVPVSIPCLLIHPS